MLLTLSLKIRARFTIPTLMGIGNNADTDDDGDSALDGDDAFPLDATESVRH